MKFPRNARIFRGQLDAAPFISVFFLLVIFVMLGSLVYTPGVHIQLPSANGLAGTAGPTIAVAVDANGQFYFHNRLVKEAELTSQLREAASQTPGLTLVVYADAATRMESLDRLTVVAGKAGIRDLVRATLQRAFTPTAPLLK